MTTAPAGSPEAAIAAPGFAANPYPTYAQLRREAPVYHCEAEDYYLVTRYDDCMAIVKDTDTFHSGGRMDRRVLRFPEELRAEMIEVYAGFSGFFFSDPPEYTGHRNRVGAAFRPEIADIEDHIRELVEGLLAPNADAGRIDVVGDLAYPLPATVILELMGVPESDREQFKHWTQEMFRLAGAADNLEDARAALASMRDSTDWFRAMVAEARANPRGMLGVLVRDMSEEPSATELQSFAVTFVQFLVAGHETTTNLLASMTWLLLTHPDALARLREDRTLVPKAVEESLRIQPPLHWLARRVGRDTELRGVELPEGSEVQMVIAAANRDPEQFPDPDTFLVDRQPNRHLALGFGPHFCLGAPLARLEARIVLEVLLDRFEELTLLDPEPHWSEHVVLHGLRRLDVGLVPRAAGG
jgi:cytochrome P450